MHTIGRLAKASGVHIETIRYYERIGLVEAPPRTAAGHRVYDDGARQRLTFIRRARELGFPLEEVRELLKLSEKSDQPCAPVAKLARDHLESVRQKIADLTRLEAILGEAVVQCETLPTIDNCPVLEMLSD